MRQVSATAAYDRGRCCVCSTHIIQSAVITTAAAASLSVGMIIIKRRKRPQSIQLLYTQSGSSSKYSCVLCKKRKDGRVSPSCFRLTSVCMSRAELNETAARHKVSPKERKASGTHHHHHCCTQEEKMRKGAL